jgi:multidrug efflux pump
MKSFTDLFVTRPVLAIVVSVVIVIAGLSAWSSLSVRQYPRSDNAVVNISTVYVGASAEVVRGFVTSPIERAIASVDGIEYVESKSLLGLSLVSARLKINYDTTKALVDVTAKVNQVRNELPEEAEIPAISVQTADSDFAAAYLSFSSKSRSPSEITDYIIRSVQPRLAALAGVQEIQIFGARTFAMRVWLDPQRMAAHHMSPADVHAALAANNYLAAVGNTKGSLVQVNLTTNTDLHTVDEFKRLVIRRDSDTVVRLQDVAEVELGAEDYDTRVTMNGEATVFLGVLPLPTANTLDVVGRVRADLEQIRRDLPHGIETAVAYDASEYIADAISEVEGTLIDTLLIVVLVIFLFLGSLRSVVVPVVAIPVSLIGGVFLMQVFGFTLNLLTLLAIVLSVGLVVDDAIVMVENVERHLRAGRTPLQAARAGARELIGPIIAMTITLAAVYTPIGLQGGLTGALFREFALTLAGAVMISGIVALTLSPMMSAKLLRPHDQPRGLAAWVDRAFDSLRRGYGAALDGTLNARPAVYSVWALLSLLVLPMYVLAPKELAPLEDQGFTFGIVQNAANASADQKAHFGRAAEQVFLDQPERELTFQLLLSPTDPMSVAQGVGGFAGMVLKPWTQRDRTVGEILPELQAKLASIPGLQVFAGRPPALPGGSNYPVELVLTSTDEPEQMLEYAQQLQQKAADSGVFYFPPEIDLKFDQPESEIVIDHDKAAVLGLDSAQIGADLGAALGGNYVNRFNSHGRAYKVIPQLARAERLNAEQLQDMFVTGPDEELVPLSTIATVRDTTVPRSLNRFQQLNAVKLSGMTAQVDEGLKVLEAAAREILPPGYTINYTGESRQLRTEGGKFLPALGLAIVTIFLVLAVQFNSFRDPLVILLGSVPLALFGALIFTILKMPDVGLPYFTDGWTTTINIYAQVGLVTLVGLVAKNGILIVEFANKSQEAGLSKLAAVKEAAMTRLRPVLMTSVATVAGHFPLTLVDGPGAEARNSIGLVLVGGMTIGTVFTLFVVPALYVLIAKNRREHLCDESPALVSAPVAQ